MSEHPNQDKYEDVHLTVAQWEEVIQKAKNSEQSSQHLFILKSLANQQVVSNASICAFRGVVEEDILDRSVGSRAIGILSKWVKQITRNDKAAFYEWNTIQGHWTIGTYQTFSLRMAFGHARAPKGSTGID